MSVRVVLWGTTIGAAAYVDNSGAVAFEYAPEFLQSQVEVSPFMMPLSPATFVFREIGQSFHGLPGLLADSLPDKFGNAIIDAWLAQQGRLPESFDALDRLSYTGKRGMGALEFEPITGPKRDGTPLDVARLVDLAASVLRAKNEFGVSLAQDHSLEDILRVGTSAGGARAKAVVAWNRKTGELRSGQIDHGPHFRHWLIKFDGVEGNGDKEGRDEGGFGLIEFAYHIMAVQAGIRMTECELLRENGRAHFMTARFDRKADGSKVHMQSLAALRHYDFNEPGTYSYEQAMLTISQLGLGVVAREEQYRRAVFNVLARNQDDHVKNIAFLMDKNGQWSLSPAFDVNYAYNPRGQWTSRHQMSIHGKWSDFERTDLQSLARYAGLSRSAERRIFDDVRSAVNDWPMYAHAVGVTRKRAAQIGAIHRSLC